MRSPRARGQVPSSQQRSRRTVALGRWSVRRSARLGRSNRVSQALLVAVTDAGTTTDSGSLPVSNRSTRLFRKLPNQKGGLSRRTCPLLGRKRPLANFVRERNGQFVRRIVGISACEGSLNVPYATSTGRHGLPSPFDSVDGVGDDSNSEAIGPRTRHQ